MSTTTIPVDDATKRKLDRLKRESETWADFLRRLAGDLERVNHDHLTPDEAEEAKEVIRRQRASWR